MGTVSSLGCAEAQVWNRLAAGDQSRFTQRDDLVPEQRILMGEVREELPALPTSLARHECRNNRLALLALRQMETAVQEAIESFGAERVGVVVGSSTAGIDEGEKAIAAHLHEGKHPSSFDIVQMEFGGTAECIAGLTGARGPRYTLSTACSSGAKSLGSAQSLIELGVCDAVICGGVDSVCQLTSNGFSALQAVAPELTNPMSAHRRGLTLGEGAAFFLLTRTPSEIQLLGVGEASDGYHMSAPDPEGRGAECAMHAALDDAGLSPDEIAYVNLHGTGTPHNDAMESRAIQRVFGQAPPPCSSTKPLTGHTLGASGAIELGFCWMMIRRVQALRDQGAPVLLTLPPHRFDGEYDPALPPLPLVQVGAADREPILEPVAIMSNSFGFGGSNCSLVIGESRA